MTITNSPNIMGLDQVELEVLELIAEGHTDEKISEICNVQKQKATRIRKSLIEKTNTRNSASLISFAYKYGLLKT